MKLLEVVQAMVWTHGELCRRAVRAVNFSMVVRNWLFGFHIVEFEQKGEDRAEYGAKLLEGLSGRLSQAGLAGMSVTNLKNFRRFYESMPSIRQTVSAELRAWDSSGSLADLPDPLIQVLSRQFRLGWSHYLALMGIKDPVERRFYEIEAAASGWTIRDLERQVDSGLFERLALSRDPEQARGLGERGHSIEVPRDEIKDPYVLEFLELEHRSAYSESDLERAIIDKLEAFLLELGKGFLFEARQERFTFGEDHFFVDLVFYNRLLRCYVLIDLKLGKLTHQDLGQMQMYIHYFDRFRKTGDENPTIGILLCKRKNDALVELALPSESNVFASLYQLYLPSKEELRRQMENVVREIAFHYGEVG